MFDIIQKLESHSGLLTTKDVCELLSTSRTSLHLMVVNREIPTFKVAGRRKFDPTALKRWLIKKCPELKASVTTS